VCQQVASVSSGRIERRDGDAVRAAGGGLVIASGVQGGHAQAPAYETLLLVLAIAAMAVAAWLIVVYLRRGSRRPKPVADQWSALVVMGELCPEGWQAQITLYGWGAPVPADAPQSRTPLIELEWKQFEEETGRIIVTRRVWAATIGEALQAMVDDRRTDITLEQIERAAAESGGEWWGD
jgi:hypothetical protein